MKRFHKGSINFKLPLQASIIFQSYINFILELLPNHLLITMLSENKNPPSADSAAQKETEDLLQVPKTTVKTARPYKCILFHILKVELSSGFICMYTTVG